MGFFYIKKNMIDLQFHHNSEMNMFGYYTVGDYYTYSKLDAIEVAQATNSKVVWHFRDAEWDAVDWRSEPKETLFDLYTKRALQLREKYDYIVLLYSGGADSHNMLNVFVRNGIHLDEIMQFTNMEASGNQNDFWNAELFKVAIPITQQVIDIFRLRTKHRIVDVSDDLTTLDKKFPDLSHWLYGRGSHLNLNGRVWSRIRHYHKDYKDLMDQGKKVCFLFGWDKPPIFNLLSPTHPGKVFYGIMFRDTMETVYNPMDQMANSTYIHNEAFYWSPDVSDIVVKQAHTVRRFLETVPANHPWMSTTTNYQQGTVYRDGRPHHLTMDGMHSLIYPFWDIKTFSVGKPSNMIVGERDRWMLRGHSSLRDKMISTLKELHVRSGPYWTNWHSGLTYLYGPCYTLTPTPIDAIVIDSHREFHLQRPIPTDYMRPRIL